MRIGIRDKNIYINQEKVEEFCYYGSMLSKKGGTEATLSTDKKQGKH